MNLVLQPGFFASPPVETALLVGGAAALAAAAAGIFAVLRGQAFAGHALAEISSAGGALAPLLGIGAMLGFFGMGLMAALGMAALAPRRAGGHELAAGIGLSAGLGLTALFLHFDITMKGVSGAAATIMFGSLFALPPGVGVSACLAALAALLLLALIWRPLLLAVLDGDLATVQGVPVVTLGLVYLLLLTVAVTLAAMAVGAILATALLIGPAAAALRLARRPVQAVLLAGLFGLVACWGGIWLAYQSYGWTPGRVWPVSFFITALVLLIYGLALRPWRRG